MDATWAELDTAHGLLGGLAMWESKWHNCSSHEPWPQQSLGLPLEKNRILFFFFQLGKYMHKVREITKESIVKYHPLPTTLKFSSQRQLLLPISWVFFQKYFMHRSIYLVFVYMLLKQHINGIKLHPPPFSPHNTSWQSLWYIVVYKALGWGEIGVQIQ